MGKRSWRPLIELFYRLHRQRQGTVWAGVWFKISGEKNVHEPAANGEPQIRRRFVAHSRMAIYIASEKNELHPPARLPIGILPAPGNRHLRDSLHTRLLATCDDGISIGKILRHFR
jgi:hypothetical protein